MEEILKMEIFTNPYNIAILLVGIGAVVAVLLNKRLTGFAVGVLFFTIMLKLLFGG